MAYLLEKFRDLFLGEKDEEKEQIVSGYTLMTDNNTNKTLIMEKTSNSSWKTKWVDHSIVQIQEPKEKMASVFASNPIPHKAVAERIKDSDNITQMYKDV